MSDNPSDEMHFVEKEEFEKQKQKEEDKPKDDGPDFIQIPLLRGVFEIDPILTLCELYGASVMGGYARYCA